MPVWRRSALESGATLDGPLIVEDFGATIRILSGQTLEVRPSGVLILNDREEGRMTATSILHDDPVTFEVVLEAASTRFAKR